MRNASKLEFRTHLLKCAHTLHVVCITHLVWCAESRCVSHTQYGVHMETLNTHRIWCELQTLFLSVYDYTLNVYCLVDIVSHWRSMNYR